LKIDWCLFAATGETEIASEKIPPLLDVTA